MTAATVKVGDWVVYGSHGIGRVERRGREGASLPETITLDFASGMRVTLPVARALEALRPLSSERELQGVKRMLRADAPATAEPWSRRHRVTQAKVATGHVNELAEVVRDGLRRERHNASAAGTGKTVAPSDRHLYLQARALLAAEIALCRGIEPDDADAWIDEQVCEAAVT
jgi:CarD family transcriptional regulator